MEGDGADIGGHLALAMVSESHDQANQKAGDGDARPEDTIVLLYRRDEVDHHKMSDGGGTDKIAPEQEMLSCSLLDVSLGRGDHPGDQLQALLLVEFFFYLMGGVIDFLKL